MNVFTELKWRGLIHTSSSGLEAHFRKSPVTAYVGFDPSAASLHVGSLLPMITLARLQRAGHRPIAIVGGGTGLIGDPSGKRSERPMLSRDRIMAHTEGIREQLSRVLDFNGEQRGALLLDNSEWLSDIQLLDFLRDVGKHFSLGAMLAKDSVRARLEGSGLSFTEFSYMLLQAYDFLVLLDRCGCTVQLGGSDQWGNITAGMDLVRRARRRRVHGLVMPLITTASGAKFGKTEAGTVWLDPSLTSPFRFYQFWLHTDDRDVEKYLRYFTFLDRTEIRELMEESRTNPKARTPHRRLAADLTEMIHGESGLLAAKRASSALFGGDIRELSPAEIADVFGDAPSIALSADRLGGKGVALAEILTTAGLASSRSDARRLIRAGGAYLNGEKITDENELVRGSDALGNRFLVLRRGARHHVLARLS
jgi:tyrosyl-tRNA synthetase